jgi:hypothetical protein
MKRIIMCGIVVAGLASNGHAQRRTTSLPAFSRERADQFSRQQGRAAAFATARNLPLFFTDEKGNHVRMVDVDNHGRPVYRITLNAEAAATTDTDQLHAGGALGLNIQGSGMLVGVWDGGIVGQHIELGARVLSTQGPALDIHATHVTGTLIATGINPLAKGMAPLAKATTWYFDNDEAEMAALARPDASSLLVSNHSYGTATGWFKNNGAWVWTGDDSISQVEDYRFGFYGERAQSLDQLAAMAPYYSIVWAAGNDRADVGDGSRPADCNGGSGYDCIIPESVSKNIITVGAVNAVPSYAGPFSVGMSFFSSWGPTDDGRIKPDITADGVNVFSLSAAGPNAYTSLTGTSMATPNVAGSLLLLQELYERLHGGTPMRAATLKALAIHTAKEAGSFPGPDYSFGWGLLDAGAAAKLLIAEDNQNVLIREGTLNNGQTYTIDLAPQANQKITVTVAWTDPPGTPVAPSLDPRNSMLVNDLDIRILDQQSREQEPWTLDPSNPSAGATTGDNIRDNIEKIEFDFPEGKPYTLALTHKGNLVGGTQDFSLIVSYQSTTPSRTLYWVGGSGSWNDAAHWSLTSGGTSAGTTPAATDRVMTDEHSFDSLSVQTITVPVNAACASLLWMSDRPSGLALNTNTLTVQSQFVLGATTPIIQSPGVLHFSSAGLPGSFQAKQGDLSGATIVFDGDWTTMGNITADEFQLNSGRLTIFNSALALKRLTASAVPSKQLIMNGSQISLSSSSTLGGSTMTISSIASAIRSAGALTLNWTTVDFPGSLQVDSSFSMTVNGNNRLGQLADGGTLTLTGSNQADTLVLLPGAILSLASATTQTLSSMTQTTPKMSPPVQLSSPAGAALQFNDHVKLCFDFLAVTNVNAKGMGVVNAGLNSAVIGASGWQQKDCDDVLFADFDVRYPCANGLTEFVSKTSGPMAQRRWKVGTLTLTDSAYTFTATGHYDVTLVVTNSNNRDSVTKTIIIVPNTLTANQVVADNGVLTSAAEADTYQWYENGSILVGNTSRSYDFQEGGGVYEVVTSDHQCNVVSAPFIMTGLAEFNDVNVYPNPASDVVRIVSGGTLQTISLIDLVGREVAAQTTSQSETSLAVSSLPGGVYILLVRSAGAEVRRKIIISH